MKRLLFFLVSLLPFAVAAQNYECLQVSMKNYFTNKSGYLRGIRIDSAKLYIDSVVYYPFHTARGRYQSFSILDSTGGSWLGKKVTQLNDGTSLFYNIWNDTVIIKTRAYPGDTWSFYSDTTKLYYEAEVLSTDTMTVMGATDSVKKIRITARDLSGIVTSDIANNFQILLSKNNGLVQVFDLYSFPYHAPDSSYAKGLDYYTDLVAGKYPGWSFSLIKFVNPAIKDQYQWNVGDVYEYSNCSGSFRHDNQYCNPVEAYKMDTVTSVDLTTSNPVYITKGWEARYINFYHSSLYTKSRFDNAEWIYSTALIFDTSLMPEEYRQQNVYVYQPDDSSYCINGALYSYQYNDELQRGHYSIPFESAIHGPTVYKYPLGLISSFNAGIVAEYGASVDATTLIYYDRGANSCGNYSYPPTKVNDLNTTQRYFDIHPNPATTELTISSNECITGVVISDMFGKALCSRTANSYELQINVSALAKGVYFIRINKTQVGKFVKQ